MQVLATLRKMDHGQFFWCASSGKRAQQSRDMLLAICRSLSTHTRPRRETQRPSRKHLQGSLVRCSSSSLCHTLRFLTFSLEPAEIASVSAAVTCRCHCAIRVFSTSCGTISAFQPLHCISRARASQQYYFNAQSIPRSGIKYCDGRAPLPCCRLGACIIVVRRSWKQRQKCTATTATSTKPWSI